MELISCGKNIQLHSFPKLSTVSSYGHVESRGCYDFQFFRKSKLFIASNPQKPAVEYLSLKSHGAQAKVSLVKRMHMDNLCCIASPKSNLEYVALGLSTGHVRLINYKTAEVAYRFSPDFLNNRINSMDFSSTDDYLAAISDTGSVRLFGMKSFIEMDSFNIDKNSTLGRFHPSKRFHLVVASNLGNITIYDAQVKKKTFHINRAHTSPCRDVSVSSVNDTCLLSVGLDCYINIYDTRKKSVAQQLKTEHPLSAVALSPTSVECVVGNLKGEILMFDVRKMPQSLVTIQAHENLVNRLAFVPPERMEVDFQATSTNESKDENSSAVDSESLNSSVDVFSLMPLLDQKRGSSSVATGRRDSFLDFLDAHMSSIENAGQSSDTEQKERRRSSTRRSVGLEQQEEKEKSRDDTFVTIRKKRFSGQTEPKLSDVKELEEIEEDQTQGQEIKSPHSFNYVLLVDSNSTPKAVPKLSEKKVLEKKEEPTNGQDNHEEMKSPHSFNHLLPDYRNSTPKAPEIAVPLATTVESLSEEVSKMLKRTESELKFEMNSLKWATYSEMFSLWQNQNRAIEKITDQLDDVSNALAMIMQTDDFVAEFSRLQQENDVLRKQLAQKNHNWMP